MAIKRWIQGLECQAGFDFRCAMEVSFTKISRHITFVTELTPTLNRRGSCTSKSRGNQYTIVFDHLEKHHQNESWYKKYYDTFGRSSRLSTACSAEIDQNLVVRFNNDNRKNSIGRAFAHVHMDSTCASLLKVRFFGELDPFYSK